MPETYKTACSRPLLPQALPALPLAPASQEAPPQALPALPLAPAPQEALPQALPEALPQAAHQAVHVTRERQWQAKDRGTGGM